MSINHDSPLNRVNPLQGTDSHFGFSTGNTLPLIAAPNGMTHWSPQTTSSSGGWFFHPSHRKLEGVRATHQPSPWMGDYGQFIVLPQTGPLITGAGERASGYRPENAAFHPHYFRADLLRYGCTLEMVPTERCALFQFTFAPEGDPFGAALTRRVLMDFFPGASRMEIDPDQRTVRGWTRTNSGGVPNNFAYYFVAVFDMPLTAWGLFHGRSDHRPGAESAEGDHLGAYVEFAGDQNRITLRIGTSFIGWEQAAANLAREIGDTALETLRVRMAQKWEQILGTVEVEGGGTVAQRTFASCLYRTRLFPRFMDEQTATGKQQHYSPYDGNIHEGPMVTDNGFWDTYRTVYPLLALTDPQRLSAIMQGWTNAYRESGWFPTWASPGHRSCMVGTHGDVVFADAIARGVPGIDIATAYEGLRKDAYENPPHGTGFGREGLADYLTLGYVADDRIHEASASRTIDYAFDDFCVAQVARALGKEKDYEELIQRAGYWRNVFDPAVGMMRGRNADGSWRQPWDEFEWGGPFVEGGTWQHSWGVPHDPAGLIAVMGGADAFVEKLERMLTQAPYFRIGSYGMEIHEMTEMACAAFGQYAQSNQPVHHALYLFACAGRPDRTQYWVRRVLQEMYTPDILPGDEDNGELAGWYVLSALGLYPLCAGHPSYVLGSPLFPVAHLRPEGGKQVTIRAITPEGKAVADCPFVHAVTWNGKPWTRLWIGNAELAEGGELQFTLDDTPPARRQYTQDELPFSLTPYAL